VRLGVEWRDMSKSAVIQLLAIGRTLVVDVNHAKRVTYRGVFFTGQKEERIANAEHGAMRRPQIRAHPSVRGPKRLRRSCENPRSF